MSTELRRLLPAPGVEGRAGVGDGRGAIAAVFTVSHVRDGFVMELFRRREISGRNSAYTLSGLASLPGEGKEKAPQRVSLRSFFVHHRDGGIRTRDPLNPIQVRYRAALRPVYYRLSVSSSLKATGLREACPERSEGSRQQINVSFRPPDDPEPASRNAARRRTVETERAIAREVNPIQSLSRASRGMRYRAARSLSRAQRGIP